jgi:hypothetical protein
MGGTDGIVVVTWSLADQTVFYTCGGPDLAHALGLGLWSWIPIFTSGRCRTRSLITTWRESLVLLVTLLFNFKFSSLKITKPLRS